MISATALQMHVMLEKTQAMPLRDVTHRFLHLQWKFQIPIIIIIFFLLSYNCEWIIVLDTSILCYVCLLPRRNCNIAHRRPNSNCQLQSFDYLNWCNAEHSYNNAFGCTRTDHMKIVDLLTAPFIYFTWRMQRIRFYTITHRTESSRDSRLRRRKEKNIKKHWRTINSIWLIQTFMRPTSDLVIGDPMAIDRNINESKTPVIMYPYRSIFYFFFLFSCCIFLANPDDHYECNYKLTRISASMKSNAVTVCLSCVCGVIKLISVRFRFLF